MVSGSSITTMRLAVIISSVLAFVGAQSTRPALDSVARLPLLNASSMSYLGSFRADPYDPSGQEDAALAFGGWALGVTPENTLLIGGNAQTRRLCELNIPPELSQKATFAAPCTDVTEGRLGQIDSGASTRLGGSLVWNRRLIVSAFSEYDADGSQTFSHFASGRRLTSTNDVIGPVRVGSRGAGFVSGYMGIVPDEWVTPLGGPAVTGNCCLSIISRTSSGPALSVFNPDDVGRVAPVPATEIVGYPLAQPLANHESQNSLYNLSTDIRGVAFPRGTRSVLFVGSLGLGAFCYGAGGASGGQCYDPANAYQGVHMYPYVHQVWAYDALDLVDVKDGRKQPWEVRPYTTWRLGEMDSNGRATIAGAAYDHATRRLYVTEDFGNNPEVHVYQISGGAEVSPDRRAVPRPSRRSPPGSE
jgi:hypothetical protein